MSALSVEQRFSSCLLPDAALSQTARLNALQPPSCFWDWNTAISHTVQLYRSRHLISEFPWTKFTSQEICVIGDMFSEVEFCQSRNKGEAPRAALSAAVPSDYWSEPYSFSADTAHRYHFCLKLAYQLGPGLVCNKEASGRLSSQPELVRQLASWIGTDPHRFPELVDWIAAGGRAAPPDWFFGSSANKPAKARKAVVPLIIFDACPEVPHGEQLQNWDQQVANTHAYGAITEDQEHPLRQEYLQMRSAFPYECLLYFQDRLQTEASCAGNEVPGQASFYSQEIKFIENRIFSNNPNTKLNYLKLLETRFSRLLKDASLEACQRDFYLQQLAQVRCDMQDTVLAIPSRSSGPINGGRTIANSRGPEPDRFRS